MPISKKLITELSDEIMNDWFGPTGQCWCEHLKQMIDPEHCPKNCPECEPLKSQDVKQFRYLRLHDDYRSI